MSSLKLWKNFCSNGLIPIWFWVSTLPYYIYLWSYLASPSYSTAAYILYHCMILFFFFISVWHCSLPYLLDYISGPNAFQLLRLSHLPPTPESCCLGWDTACCGPYLLFQFILPGLVSPRTPLGLHIQSNVVFLCWGLVSTGQVSSALVVSVKIWDSEVFGNKN